MMGSIGCDISGVNADQTTLTQKTESVTQTPPLTPKEITSLRDQAFFYASEFRNDPLIGIFKYRDKIKPLAEKLWSEHQYEQQAPHEVAIIYHLYAAILLLQPYSRETQLSKVYETTIPWLMKSVQLDDNAGDHLELLKSKNFLVEIIRNKKESWSLKETLQNNFRIAMLGATPEQIDNQVKPMMTHLLQLVSPSSKGGSSPKEDVEYLEAKSIGNDNRITLGKVFQTMAITFKGKFPNIDQPNDGNPQFIPLQNGNTLVTWEFSNGTGNMLKYEFEVSKSKKIIIPKSEAASNIIHQE